MPELKPTVPDDVLPLKVDLTDPADVAANLPRARSVATKMRELAKLAQDQADAWDRLVLVLEGIAGPPNGTGAKADSADTIVSDETTDTITEYQSKPGRTTERRLPSSEEVVLTIVNQTGEPITTAEVRKLAPPSLKPDTVTWALWKLKSDDRIRHLRKGVYAPVSYQPEEIFSSSESDEESEE